MSSVLTLELYKYNAKKHFCINKSYINLEEKLII